MKEVYENYLSRTIKVELYSFIYIVIFGKHLSELYWIVLMFLNPQCIVSQKDLQQKIVDWSTLHPLLSLHTSRVGKRVQEL